MNAPDEQLASELILERCGEVAAHIKHFGDASRDEVLVRLAVNPDRWPAIVEKWGDEMGAELQRGEDTLAEQFALAFAKSADALAQTKPPIETLGPMRRLPSPAPTSLEPTTSAIELGPAIADRAVGSSLEPKPAPRPVAVPSFMLTSAARQTSNPSPPSPWVAPAPPSASETVAIPAWRDDEPAVPFSSPAGPSPLSVGSGRPEQQSGETVAVPVEALLAGQTLPFGPKGESGWSLDSYAQLCAELAIFPELRPQVLERLNLTEETLRSVNSAFAPLLSTDPRLRQTFDTAHAKWRRRFTTAREYQDRSRGRKP